MNKESIVTAVFKAVDDVNLQLPADGRLEKSLQEVLVGEGCKLDSLGMVNFLVAVEEKVEAELGQSVSVATELLSGDAGASVKDLQTLVDYIASKAG